jgi:hypothetical protein
MKRKHIVLKSAVLACITLAAGFGLSTFFPAPARVPQSLEYLPGTTTSTIDLVGTARAAETGELVKKSRDTNGHKLTLYDFSGETVGAPPKSFAAAVGNWLIGTDGDNKVLVVDGRSWRRGVPSAGLADKARALYGERYAEFLDNVKAYAYYPFAVATGIDDFQQGKITFRFKAIAGRIDQGAGILFDLKPNGDYYALRANPLENNLVLWRYKHGRRSSVAWVRNVNTPSRTWHTLTLSVKGNTIKGSVNGKHYLTSRLPAPVSGRVGVWTKADSVVYFDDYQVIQ